MKEMRYHIIYIDESTKELSHISTQTPPAVLETLSSLGTNRYLICGGYVYDSVYEVLGINPEVVERVLDIENWLKENEAESDDSQEQLEEERTEDSIVPENQEDTA